MHSQKELAQIAIDGSLFMPGWNLEKQYQDILVDSDGEDNENLCWIHIHFLNESPVAVATINLKELCINVYVDKNHRGQNLGIKVINELLKQRNLQKDEVHAFLGEDGTDFFYRKAGIACFIDALPLTSIECQAYMDGKITYESLVKKRIKEKLDDYANNRPMPQYHQKYPRT